MSDFRSLSTIVSSTDKDIKEINCERCGKFSITEDAITFYNRNYSKDISKLALISHWIRKHQKDKGVSLSLNTLKHIIDTTEFPSVKEQADNLVLWLGKNSETPDHMITSKINILSAIAGTKQAPTVRYFVNSLEERGIVKAMGDTSSQITMGLTFNGWAYYDKILTNNSESKLVFMAMGYSNKVLDKVYNTTIKKAVKDAGFLIRRLDEEKRAGLIDDKMRVEIRKSKFMIADLTDNNNGAYWEAGYAEGLGKQVIYICEAEKFEKDKPHFDINHHLTVIWDNSNLQKFYQELKATIRATFPDRVKFGR